MSEYRFVSFVPVVGERLCRYSLYRLADRTEHDDNWFPSLDMVAAEWMLTSCEFIRPADSESPSEPVHAAIQATPAMTVREQFVLAAMQVLLKKGVYIEERTPRMAVEYADALIAELAKPKVIK